MSVAYITRRLLPSVAIACAAGWALWLAPLQQPRAVLSNVYATSLHFSPDSRLLAAIEYGSGSVRIFRISDGSQLYRFDVVDDTVDQVAAIAFSPDGESAAVLTQDGIVATWCLATGNELTRHDTSVNAGARAWEQHIRHGPDGRLIIFDSGAIYETPPQVRWVGRDLDPSH